MASTRITVKRNGSLRVEGDFEIVDAEGRPFGWPGRTHVGLCRCGRSSRKPFCDGAHRAHGFVSEVRAFELDPPVPEGRP